MTKQDVLIAELKGEENKLRTKSSEVSRKAKKYDYIVQVWQGGEWFSIYCDSDYNKAKAIMDNSKYQYTRLHQLY